METPREYTDEQRDVALTFVEVHRAKGESDGVVFRQAAKDTGIDESTLRFWADGGSANGLTQPPDPELIPADAAGTRPLPPEWMAKKYRKPLGIFAAPEVEAWIRKEILTEGGALFNKDHRHLRNARIGVLWTNVLYTKGGKFVGGEAMMPLANTKNKWQEARETDMFHNWFGHVPDFCITLDAVYSAEAEDAAFCALVEHELYHCGQKRDEFKVPKWNRKTGKPVYCMAPHGCEEFPEVVARYGVEAGAAGVLELVAAALSAPTVAKVSIALACGNCRR